MKQKELSKVDVYNSDYTKLNHAYITMYDTCQKLALCADADPDVLSVLREILFALDPALDRIKSEMTVKTRFADEEGGIETEAGSGGGKIFHPKFE